MCVYTDDDSWPLCGFEIEERPYVELKDVGSGSNTCTMQVEL